MPDSGNNIHTDIRGQETQNGSSMFIGEGYDLKDPMNIPGFKQTTNFKPNYAGSTGGRKEEKKKNLVSRFFSNMSRLGMSYEQDVVRNMRALPADKSLLPKSDQLVNQDLFSLASPWKVKTNAEKAFYEKDFAQKRDSLRKLALQPELEDILDTMTDECVVYDNDFTYFCEPFIESQELGVLQESARKKITDTLAVSFRKFYKMLSWKYHAWDDFKKFLIEGILSYEIVYDDLSNPKEIIGIIPVDAATLTKSFNNGKWYWIQYKGTGRERKLLDSQIVYIAYQETGASARTSYLERLIRPFNIYRIIEQAQLIWIVTNSSWKCKFTIPVKGMTKAMGLQTLGSAMNSYREDIKFISDTGELQINGQTNLPFNKEYWFPENDSGSPEIETIGGDGPDLSDNDQLKYFKNQIYRISKIPLSRFDQDSGETWFGTDASSVERTEINFGRYVTRLRNIFSQIMIKPLQIQLALSIPELQDNRQVLEAVSLQYKSYNLFEEMMDMDMMSKKVDFIQSMKDGLVDIDAQGAEHKFFSSDFLVRKYLKLSDADLDLNTKLKREEILRQSKEVDALEDPDRAKNNLDTFDSLSPQDKKVICEKLNISETALRTLMSLSERKKKDGKVIPPLPPLDDDTDSTDDSEEE